jgi:DNA-binding transcriptional LysR family regulator
VGLAHGGAPAGSARALWPSRHRLQPVLSLVPVWSLAALGMSQTMATKHVGALEQRLGVKLLHRTTRKITLTEAGRRYLESVKRILAELAEAEAAAAAERVEVAGTLRVNAPVSFGCANSRH